MQTYRQKSALTRAAAQQAVTQAADQNRGSNVMPSADTIRQWMQLILAVIATLASALWWTSRIDARVSHIEDFAGKHDARWEAAFSEASKRITDLERLCGIRTTKIEQLEKQVETLMDDSRRERIYYQQYIVPMMQRIEKGVTTQTSR